MAFSTQKDFFYVPFMNETVEYECKPECVKLKSYESATDDRSWATKDGQQSRYLSDLVNCRIPVVTVPHDSSEEDNHDEHPARRSPTRKSGGRPEKGHGKDSPRRGKNGRDKAEDGGGIDGDEKGQDDDIGDPRGSRGRTKNDPNAKSGRDGKADKEPTGNEDGTGKLVGKKSRLKTGLSKTEETSNEDDDDEYPYPTGFKGPNDSVVGMDSNAGLAGKGSRTGRPDGNRGDKDNLENAGSRTGRPDGNRGDKDNLENAGSRTGRPDGNRGDKDNLANAGSRAGRPDGNRGDKDNLENAGSRTGRPDGNRGDKDNLANAGSRAGRPDGNRGDKDNIENVGSRTGRPDGNRGDKDNLENAGSRTGRPDGKRGDKDNLEYSASGTRSSDGKRGDKDNLENSRSGTRRPDGKRADDDSFESDVSRSRRPDGKRGDIDNLEKSRSGTRSPDGKRGDRDNLENDGSVARRTDGKRGDTDNFESDGSRSRRPDGKRGDKDTFESDGSARTGFKGLDDRGRNRNDNNGDDEAAKYGKGTARRGSKSRVRGADESGSDEMRKTESNGLDANVRNGSDLLGGMGTSRSGQEGRARGVDPSRSDDKRSAASRHDMAYSKMAGPKGANADGAGPDGSNEHDSGIGIGSARSGRLGGPDRTRTSDGVSGNYKTRGGSPGGFGSDTSLDQEEERIRREGRGKIIGLEIRGIAYRAGDVGQSEDQRGSYAGTRGNIEGDRDGVATGGTGKGGAGKSGAGGYGQERDVGRGSIRQGGIVSINIDEFDYRGGVRQTGIPSRNIDTTNNARSATGLDGAGRHQDVPFGGAGRSGTGEQKGGRRIGSPERDGIRPGGNTSGQIGEYGNERSAFSSVSFRQVSITSSSKEGAGAGPGGIPAGKQRSADNSSTNGAKFSALNDDSKIGPGDPMRTSRTRKGANDSSGKLGSSSPSRYQRNISGTCANTADYKSISGCDGAFDINARHNDVESSKVQNDGKSCICSSTPEDGVRNDDSSLIHVANSAMARLEEMLLQKNCLEKQLAVFNKRLNDTAQERDELRDKLKRFKDMEQKIAELQRTAWEATQASNQLNTNFYEQAKYTDVLESELRKTENYYEEKLKELMQREQCALRQANSFKEELEKASQKDPKIEALKRENGELCFQVKALNMALSEYDCQYKQLLMKIAMFRNQGYSFTSLNSDQSDCSTDKSDY